MSSSSRYLRAVSNAGRCLCARRFLRGAYSKLGLGGKNNKALLDCFNDRSTWLEAVALSLVATQLVGPGLLAKGETIQLPDAQDAEGEAGEKELHTVTESVSEFEHLRRRDAVVAFLKPFVEAAKSDDPVRAVADMLDKLLKGTACPWGKKVTVTRDGVQLQVDLIWEPLTHRAAVKWVADKATEAADAYLQVRSITDRIMRS